MSRDSHDDQSPQAAESRKANATLKSNEKLKTTEKPEANETVQAARPCDDKTASAASQPVLETHAPRTLGQRLRELRTRHGLSQRELAKRAQVTNSTISQVEQDAVSPSVSSLHKILEVFPVSLSDFFSDEIPEAPSRILRREDHDAIENDANRMTLQRLPTWLAGSAQAQRDVGITAPEIQLGQLQEGASASLQAHNDSVVVVSRGALRITLNTSGTEALDALLRTGDAVRLHAGERYRLHHVSEVPPANETSVAAPVFSLEDLSPTAHWINIAPAR